MLKTATRYRVQIHADGPHKYKTTGAVSISAAFNPFRSAALALLEAGADPADKLAGVWEGAAISAVTLSRMALPYTPPRAKSYYSPVASSNVD